MNSYPIRIFVYGEEEAENAHQNKIVPLECQKLSSAAIK